MLKQYLKQVFVNLRSQKMLSGLQIIGTGLAIFIIMVYVVMNQVQTEPFSPESHRDRFLHFKQASCRSTDSTWGFSSEGHYSIKMARGCFRNLNVPEAVTIYTSNELLNISIPHGTEINSWVKGVDEGFWNVFDFTFIDGRPFNEAESESGQFVTILSESIAQQFFNNQSAIGHDIYINKNAYHIVGVVKDVTPLANTAFAQAWIPYMSTAAQEITFMNGYCGGILDCTILAHSIDDFDAIHEECEKERLRYNESIKADNVMLIYKNQPYTQEKAMTSINTEGHDEPDMSHEHLLQALVIFILLIVPTINLSSMTQSRFRQRITEIGVRRAFGASHHSILWQVIVDNLVLTFFAGILGLIFCILLAIFGSQLLFDNTYLSNISSGTNLNVDLGILMHISTFVLAFLFCLLLNIMSSFIPAWKASRANIIAALNQK